MLNAIETALSPSFDFISRTIYIGGDRSAAASLCWLDGLVNGDAIAETVIRPLTDPLRFCGSDSDILDKIAGGGVVAATVNRRNSAGDVISDILNGYCALVMGREAVTFETKSTDARSVEAPKEEKVIKGSKDAFSEIIKTNVTLIRRRLRNPHLRFKTLTVGEKSDTTAAVVYIEGFTDPELVSTAEQRLGRISAGGAVTSAVIESGIVDNPKSPFPQLIITERADKFCLNLLEGRVGVLVDNLPMGYLAPGTFRQMFKVPEDAANHFTVAAMLTFLRYAAMFITLFLPAFYVAVALYHHEMLPAKLMESIIEAKQSVPFPTAAEITLMLIAFELIQEAGLRLPNPIGEIVSIIGALIVGQAAVEARVVSPIVVIIIAVSGIAGSLMPSQDMASALRMTRFVFVLLAIASGMFGIAIGAAALAYHLGSIETFGRGYL